MGNLSQKRKLGQDLTQFSESIQKRWVSRFAIKFPQVVISMFQPSEAGNVGPLPRWTLVPDTSRNAMRKNGSQHSNVNPESTKPWHLLSYRTHDYPTILCFVADWMADGHFFGYPPPFLVATWSFLSRLNFRWLDSYRSLVWGRPSVPFFSFGGLKTSGGSSVQPDLPSLKFPVSWESFPIFVGAIYL